MSPRTQTPPRCGKHTDEQGREWPGCGAPGAWAWLGPNKSHAKWYFIEAQRGDGAMLTPTERLEKIRFDEDLHVQHRCREAGPEPAPAVTAAPTAITPRVYLAGQALAGLIGRGHISGSYCSAEAVAYADALLAELERTKG